MSNAYLRSAVVAVFLVATLAFQSGCSFVFVDGPPSRGTRPRQVACTSESVLPEVDVTITVVQAIRTVVAMFAPDEWYRGGAIDKPVDVMAGLAMTGLFLASATTGASRIEACREFLAHPGPPLPTKKEQRQDEADEEAAVEANRAARANAAAAEEAKAAAAAAAAAAAKGKSGK